jgi:hypothetical protein
MGVRQRILRAALAVCALACALPAHALAAHTQESILMDDNHLIYATPKHMAQTLRQIKALGVDRVKVSVVWQLVAPDAASHHKPKFDASNPAAYPYGAWTRWDQLVAWSKLLGLKVYFQISPPAPAWATSAQPEKSGQGYTWSEKPNAGYFRQFVEAIGRRYSGSYGTSNPGSLVPPRELGVSGRSGVTPTASDPNPPLQRVNYWGVWNEPNEPGWLSPQFKVVHGHRIDTAPGMYRRLVDGAYSGLKASGHRHDTFLVGETASHGWIYPIPFTQELYCVDSRYRPLKGTAARNEGCPQKGRRSSFVSKHPGLFAFHGFAYHPYSFDTPPARTMSDPNLITLANLGKMERAVDRAHGAYGKDPRGGVPMYLTEWGYKTNPPNPFVKTSLSEQAIWLNEGEYMTFRDRRVRSLAQFLLLDDTPRAGAVPGSRSYWSTFQTGLIFASGKFKPAYTSFRMPIWLPSHRHGSRVAVWGQFRPADHSTVAHGVLRYRRHGSKRWGTLAKIQTASSEGFLVAHVRIPAAGAVKLSWRNPANGRSYFSRVVGIS